MTANGWLQILLFLALVFLVTKPMGIFMTRVFQRRFALALESGEGTRYHLRHG
jgi:K+-transporting ATPase ATPase A chain